MSPNTVNVCWLNISLEKAFLEVCNNSNLKEYADLSLYTQYKMPTFSARFVTGKIDSLI